MKKARKNIEQRQEAMLIYDFVSKEVIGIDTRKVAKGPLKWQSAVSLAGSSAKKRSLMEAVNGYTFDWING